MPKDKPGKTPKEPPEPTPFERFEELTRRVLTAGKPPRRKPKPRTPKR